MKKKTVIILAVVLLIAALAGGLIAYRTHYNNTHIFVEDAVYEKDAVSLDLRGTGISVAHYEEVRSQLPGCEITWELPFQGGFIPCDAAEIAVTSLSAEDVALLDYLTELTKVDANGCTDYEQIQALQERRPELSVSYQVAVNGEQYPQDVQALALPDADGAELMAALAWLPDVTSVTIDKPTMPAADLLALVETYPNVAFSWNAEVLGNMYPSDTTELNFANIQLDSLEALEQELAYLPALEMVDLSWCGIGNEELAEYRERQKDNYKVVWTVKLGWAIEIRTDATTFMPVILNKGNVWDQSLVDLKYCNEMICVDVGHMPISHCDWAAYMPELRYLIVADSGINNIEGVRGLQKLAFLETFTTPLTDYSPLLECPAIEDLNIVNTQADPEVLAQLKSLKRLYWSGFPVGSLDENTKQMLREALPDTFCELEVTFPTGNGWRKGGLYYEMRDVLGMPYFGQ